MAKTKAQIIAEAQVVKNATEVGENTATRVGGVLEDLADADSVVIIPVTGTESGGSITLSSNPFTQVQTAVNAGQHVVVRVTYGIDIADFTMNTYSASVATYIGTANFLENEFQLLCSASSAVITNRSTSNTFSTGESVPNVGIDATPTQGSDNLVKSGGIVTYTADQIAKVATITTPNLPKDFNIIPITKTTGKYMNTDGSTGNASNGWYSQHIAVEQNDYIYLVNGSYDVQLKRMLTAFDANGNAISSQGQSVGHDSYKVLNANVKSVVISFIGTDFAASVMICKNNIFENAVLPQNPLGAQSFQKDTMTSDELLTARPLAVALGNRLSFSCNLSSMGTLYIGGISISGSFVPNLIITSTQLIWHNGDNADVSVNHGLTISDDLQVLIKQKDNINLSTALTDVDIIVTSKGVSYIWSVSLRILFTNRPFGVKMSGASMSNVSFGCTSKTLTCPVWYFGDSYISLYNERWTRYYLRDFGYNIMLCGYAGANSTTIFSRLLNLLNLRKPKYIVWALGMNDRDTSSSSNYDWNACYTYLKDLCPALGIEFIPCTIPTTPNRQNDFKNDIVRASGLRYVDFDIAVRPDQSVRTWITGALSSDNVHPTAAGANILYHRLLADVPELMM